MVNVALKDRNMYEDFELESDILYFKTGVQDLVSFHGRNYNIKKRMTSDQLNQLISNSNFFQISSNCYINISKIKSIASGTIYFGEDTTDAKRVSVNRRKQSMIQQLFSKQTNNIGVS